jgi:tRNA modification GTPase
LRERLGRVLDADAKRERADIANVRHVALVERAHLALQRARLASTTDTGAMPEEFVLADLQDARAALEEITGRRTSEELLAHIFTRFCVGK